MRKELLSSAMDEIRRADTKNLILSLLGPWRLLAFAAPYFMWLTLYEADGPWNIGLIFWLAGAGYYFYSAIQDFKRRRFINREHGHLWAIIEDRVKRLKSAIRKSPMYIKPGTSEIPKTVERTARHLYGSLRRADIVKNEIIKSEGPHGISTLPFQARIADVETNELYVLADKSVAEYRRHFEHISANVTRTEGQCALFISALDSLRVQLLGYRLSSKEPAVTNSEIIGTVKEVQLQLDAIDKALDELDLQPVAQIRA